VLSIWDLDNLKYTNDTYGHEIGDRYICTLSDLLKRKLPENSISARLAGDEFTVILYDEPKHKLEQKLREIHQLLMKERLSLPDGHELNMSASAGMAFYDEDATNYAELLKYADFAMYQIKKSSKGSIKTYNKESYVKDYILVQGVGELDRIIIDEAVHYAYQPIIDIQTGDIFAYEALIRPESDLLGRPDNLLRVAESQFKLDKIERLTWFHALKGFFDQVHEDDNAHIFINSIPNQLISEEDWRTLEDLYGDKLNRVVMEITENAKSEIDIDEKKRAFCRKWNIPIALDDYGSGYSNSDLLVTRMFHFVKLDMGLIQGIDKNASAQALVRNTIEYCHENLLRVIAEGIETQEEYDTVKELGADFVQGFLLAKPSITLYQQDLQPR
nr:GGDEF and EAL domain-containing protein [Lachnospiraceae bacterium]